MKLQPPPNDATADLVETPAWLARAIVRAVAPTGRCLDPSAGYLRRPFFDALLNEPGMTHAYACELRAGTDFLADWALEVDWVITNPPWSKVRPFLVRAMTISENVVFLVTLNHLFTKRRLADVRDAGFGLRHAWLVPTPPPPWPGSGFQLAATWLQRGWDGPLTLDTSLLSLRGDDRAI